MIHNPHIDALASIAQIVHDFAPEERVKLLQRALNEARDGVPLMHTNDPIVTRGTSTFGERLRIPNA